MSGIKFDVLLYYNNTEGNRSVYEWELGRRGGGGTERNRPPWKRKEEEENFGL